MYTKKPKITVSHSKLSEFRIKNLSILIPCSYGLSAAALMHTFNAHAATDITGFGILGHAQNLAQQQQSEVSFVIHNLPIIAKMTAITKACGNRFSLLQGTSAETSGEWMFPKIDDFRNAKLWPCIKVADSTTGGEILPLESLGDEPQGRKLCSDSVLYLISPTGNAFFLN